MFVSAGEPGNAKKVQVSVAAARKVFRIFGVRTSPALSLCICSSASAVLVLLPLRPVLHQWIASLQGIWLACLTCLFGAPPQPLEQLTPLVLNPRLNPNKPLAIELINKVRQLVYVLCGNCVRLCRSC